MHPLLIRFFPFLSWQRFTSQTVREDVVAGITVSLVAVPQALAYAQLAGVPPYYGLYAAFIPTIIGVLFGSSAILSTGPVAMTSLLTAASIAPLAALGSEQFYAYAILLALLSGLIQIGFGLARMGVLLNFLSHPVLMGFINAAALIIAISQIPAFLGISIKQSKHLMVDTWNVLTNFDALHGMSLAFGLGAFALLYFFKKVFPKLPGVLITVGLLTWVSYLVGFAEHGGRVVGEIPKGLPSLTVPSFDWPIIRELLPAAFVVALISFVEAMSSCKVIAMKTRSRWNENQELIGQGLAKVAAAFCQSMPVSGSFSRSALNLASHARTGLSSLVSAAFVLLTLLFFTDAMYHLPKPVLAAMIMMAVANLLNFKSIQRAWRSSRDDGIAAITTFFATLAFAPNIQDGILTGIMLSLALFFYRRMRPRIIIALGLHPDGTLRDAARFDLPLLPAQIGALRFDSSLLFFNTAYFEDSVLKLMQRKPEAQYILIAASGINHLDGSGVEILNSLAKQLYDNGITMVFSGLKMQVLEVMERTGLIETIGKDNIYSTDKIALEALQARVGGVEP
ncbi:MAG: SulP family inorganic anion transporter [Nitrosomonadales bacterium]|nr:SulP family inorganic anion transporter [Nitrosomonadales bacterium]